MDAVAVLGTLLWLYWVLATGAAATALMPIPAIKAFRDAVTLSACRGKLWSNRPKAKLGLLKDASLPQSWFSHFYALGTLCNACLLCALACSPSVLPGAPAPLPGQRWGLAVATLLQLHLVRRLVETLWVMRYPAGARMHMIAYAFGLSYYAVLSLSCMGAADLRRLAAASQPLLAALWPTTSSGGVPHPLPSAGNLFASLGQQLEQALWQARPRQLAGAAVFLAGNLLQAHSHYLLGRLQRGLERAGPRAEGREYVIPYGGMFTLVSCPHYLGEVVIYLGLAMAAGRGQPLVWLIFTWVVVNLVLAAGRTHTWYKDTFGNAYPRDRQALIPFVY